MRIVAVLVCGMMAVSSAAYGDVLITYTEPGGTPITGPIELGLGETLPLELHVISDVEFDSTDVFMFEQNDGAVSIINAVVAADGGGQLCGFWEPDYYGSFTTFVRTGDNWLMSFDLSADAVGSAVLGANDLNNSVPGGSVIGRFGGVLPADRVPLPATVNSLMLTITPEPTTLCLLALGGIAALRRRR